MSVTMAGFAQSDDVVVRTRRALSQAQRRAAVWTAALLGDTVGMPPHNEFGILMYHRIANPVTGHPFPTWNVAPARFRQQLTGLLQRGFQAWPLQKVLAHRRCNLPIPKRVFVVTFDDGYENNFTQALPILQELKVPATIFLATAFIGSQQPLPFDDWSAKGSPDVPVEAWRALSLEQCHRLQASGLVELAAHTHTHQDFRGRPNALADDLRQCRHFLHAHFGLTDLTFAFPYGTKKLGFSGPAMASVVQQQGFLCSLTTEWELARLRADPFDWGRLTAEQSDSAATLAGKLTGWFSLLRRGVRAVQGLVSGRSSRAGDSATETAATMPTPPRECGAQAPVNIT